MTGSCPALHIGGAGCEEGHLAAAGVVRGARRDVALVVQDIDAPDPEGPIVPWTHWASPTSRPPSRASPRASPARSAPPECVNDWKQPGWRGLIPSSRGHLIQFKLYALDDEVHLGNKARHHRVTKDKLMEAIEGHGEADGEGDEGWGLGAVGGPWDNDGRRGRRRWAPPMRGKTAAVTSSSERESTGNPAARAMRASASSSRASWSEEEVGGRPRRRGTPLTCDAVGVEAAGSILPICWKR
ncbi:hypothetical protein E2562_004558 [Oryza meyeriana var. granulata]|uniref:Uncharacterized protein n=1 Tax=Oryza meyeriana var. granulata TaxID=110450 RepID=A0A6G1F3H3_9ORYZ|nr:hypothetical protein E2562_004558 [Oryza meyeriana var. granulata]